MTSMLTSFSLTDLLKGFAKRAYPSNPRPAFYYIHPDEKLFIRDFRQDVTAADCPTTGTGKYLVMDFEVPKSQTWIVKGFAPYAMERTNVGFAESARYIAPQEGNGWFSFAPIVAGGAPFLVQTNYNAPQNDGGAQSDLIRQQSNGISQISVTPYDDALRQMINPFFNMQVKSEQRFQATFSLMGPPASANPITNPYVIGTPSVPGNNKRVDFAGVVVVGLMLGEAAYRETAELFGKNGLNP